MSQHNIEGQNLILQASMPNLPKIAITHSLPVLSELPALSPIPLWFHLPGEGFELERQIQVGDFQGVAELIAIEPVAAILGKPVGRDRFTAAIARGIPLVLSCGHADVIPLADGTLCPVDRRTLDRLGKELAEICCAATAPCLFLFPRGGLSRMGTRDSDRDRTILQSFQNFAWPEARIVETEWNADDPEFIKLALNLLLEMIPRSS